MKWRIWREKIYIKEKNTSVDLAHHEVFQAKGGKGVIIEYLQMGQIRDTLPREAVGQSAVCNCEISWSYSFVERRHLLAIHVASSFYKYMKQNVAYDA